MQREAVSAGNGDDHLLEIRGAAGGQPLQIWPFGCDTLAAGRIAASHVPVEEGAVAIEIAEVGTALYQQRIPVCALEMAVGAFDRAILMCQPR